MLSDPPFRGLAFLHFVPSFPLASPKLRISQAKPRTFRCCIILLQFLSLPLDPFPNLLCSRSATRPARLTLSQVLCPVSLLYLFVSTLLQTPRVYVAQLYTWP